MGARGRMRKSKSRTGVRGREKEKEKERERERERDRETDHDHARFGSVGAKSEDGTMMMMMRSVSREGFSVRNDLTRTSSRSSVASTDAHDHTGHVYNTSSKIITHTPSLTTNPQYHGSNLGPNSGISSGVGYGSEGGSVAGSVISALEYDNGENENYGYGYKILPINGINGDFRQDSRIHGSGRSNLNNSYRNDSRGGGDMNEGYRERGSNEEGLDVDDKNKIRDDSKISRGSSRQLTRREIRNESRNEMRNESRNESNRDSDDVEDEEDEDEEDETISPHDTRDGTADSTYGGRKESRGGKGKGKRAVSKEGSGWGFSGPPSDADGLSRPVTALEVRERSCVVWCVAVFLRH